MILISSDLDYIMYSMESLGRYDQCSLYYNGEIYPIRGDIDYVPNSGNLVLESSRDYYGNILSVFGLRNLIQFYKRDIDRIRFKIPEGEEFKMVCAYAREIPSGEYSLVIVVGDEDMSMSDIGR